MIRRPPRSTRTHTLSLHDALPISDRDSLRWSGLAADEPCRARQGREWLAGTLRINLDSRRGPAAAHFVRISFRSEEHTSELQSLMRISYAVFCLKKKK